MRRRSRANQLSVSLFPFLSVLLCAMGVLIVVISTQNVLGIGTADFVVDLVGSETEREAVYVDCVADGIVILPAQTAVPLHMLRRDANSPFAALLDRLELSGGKEYLVLLVRPEGVESYRRAVSLATQVWHDIHIGKDALLPGTGKVILISENGKRTATPSKGGQQP